LAFVGHVVVEALVEKMMSPYRERRKMRKEIARLQDHYILCGFGRVGASAVEFFLKAGVEFVVIEAHEGRCRFIQERGFRFIQGDATNEETLLEAGLKEARGLLALLPSDPHNLFIVLTARELNPTLHIITRAEEPSSEKKLLRAGADNVVSPFTTAGQKIAISMLSATGRPVPASCGPPSSELRPLWVEVQKGSSMEGLTIGQLTRETGGEILGVRKASGRDLLAPAPDVRVERGDLLLILTEGRPEEEEEALKSNSAQKKVLLVDDNPVILGLYKRLLRRAGFFPLTASNGQEALEALQRERPSVAIIDYRLPVLSGIEVCRKARSMPELQEIKILLFTGDEDPRIRKRALKAGADAFLRKSPDAHELIEAVNRLLQGDGCAEELGDGARPRQKAVMPKGGSSGRSQNPLSHEEMQRILERVDGDLSLLRQIRGLLSSQIAQFACQIQEALETQDSASLAQAAHQIKGSMGNLGAQRAFEAACLLEESAKKEDFRRTEETWQALKQELDRLERGLALLLDGRSA